MTVEKLAREFPVTYHQAIVEGIIQERARHAALEDLKGRPRYAGNPVAAEYITAAMVDDTSATAEEVSRELDAILRSSIPAMATKNRKEGRR